MFDRILVAVGGDDASFRPARIAGRLARELGAQLSILTVRPETDSSLGEPFYSQTLNERVRDSEEILDYCRRLAQNEGANLLSLESLEGEPAERIIDLARTGGYNLIVLGCRRRGRIETALLGSVSAAVAAHSRVPVLVVPEPLPQSMDGARPSEDDASETKVADLGNMWWVATSLVAGPIG